MTIKKMSLAWITVKDLSKTKDFFTNVVGLRVADDSSAEHGWLELSGLEGGMLLGVGKECSEMGVGAGSNAVVTMTVDDIVTARKEMESKGVRFFGDTIEVPGHVKMATFVDPDDNMFQLVQQLGDK